MTENQAHRRTHGQLRVVASASFAITVLEFARCWRPGSPGPTGAPGSITETTRLEFKICAAAYEP